MPTRHFGDIDGVTVGDTFANRHELHRDGVHRPTQAGISGSAYEGADSIVVSGGYEDDADFGDIIIYTGHGGRDPSTGSQTSDQKLTKGNMALAGNKMSGLPVRVIRGTNQASPHAPASGYRYDGLYRVGDYWCTKGLAGFLIWQYRLIKLDEGPATPQVPEVGRTEPRRRPSSVLRIVRDTKVSRSVKKLHDFQCQACGTRLAGPAGPYAEAAHIHPLGMPHDGPDTPDNILCLCPNHHVLFDVGAFALSDDLEMIGLGGRLRTHPEHQVSIAHVRYHSEHYGGGGQSDG